MCLLTGAWCAVGPAGKEKMVPILPCLLLLCWVSASRAQENTTQIVKVTESQTVFLPCPFDSTLASNSLTWLSPSEEELLDVYVEYYSSNAILGNAWGLLLHNISTEDGVWFTCNWNRVSGTNYKISNRTEDGRFDKNEQHGKKTDDHWKEIAQPARDLKFFPCDAQVFNNWTEGSLLWIHHDKMSPENTVLTNLTIRRSSHYWLRMRPNVIFLIIPSVTSKDAGNYTCQWNNDKYHVQLEVMAKSDPNPLGNHHWIIWTVALTCPVACVSFIFCFLMLERARRARKHQIKKRSHAGRCFYAKRKKGHFSNGTLALPANDDATDAFSYENVLSDTGMRSGQQLLQKGKILPNNVNMEDEEEYEQPDSEAEFKSDDDNYENTQEDMKQEVVVLNDASPYENSAKKKGCGSHNKGSADQLCANNGLKIPKILTQDSLDADDLHYENMEEEAPFRSGAAQLIAGLRLELAMDPHVDKQDGVSENSTGSQSYEEMNGSLSPNVVKNYLYPNTSNEEDADSYENMESPDNFSSWKEDHLDLCREGRVFSDAWQDWH